MEGRVRNLFFNEKVHLKYQQLASMCVALPTLGFITTSHMRNFEQRYQKFCLFLYIKEFWVALADFVMQIFLHDCNQLRSNQ